MEAATHQACSGSYQQHGRTRSYVDGLGRPRASLQQTGTSSGGNFRWNQTGIAVLGARGTAYRSFNPGDVRVLGSTGTPDTRLALALPAKPSVEREFDAFGRPVAVTERDEAVSRMEYGALESRAYDALDTGEVGSASGTAHFVGTPTIARVDGHGRAVDQVLINRNSDGSGEQFYRLFTTYRADGAVLSVRRAETADSEANTTAALDDHELLRVFYYDTVGRRVGATDPDSDSQDTAAPASAKGWRYRFSTVGDLIAVRDARGCGQNFYYDHAGRLVAEDYVECGESELGDEPLSDDALDAGHFAQPGLTPASTVRPDVRHYFDELPHYAAAMTPPTSTDLVGRLTGSVDRGQRSVVAYDVRGRPIWSARQMALLGSAPAAATTLTAASPSITDDMSAAATRQGREFDTTHTYESTSTYDRIDRPIGVGLPADPDFSTTDPGPVISGAMQYRLVGLPNAADILIDGVPTRIGAWVYNEANQPILQYIGFGAGHIGNLRTHYDSRLRPTFRAFGRHEIVDGSEVIDSNPGSTALNAINHPVYERYVWDAADNLITVTSHTSLNDAHQPPDQRARRMEIDHDALYRVSHIGFLYRSDAGGYTDDTGPATDWRAEQAHHEPGDPMRRDPAPMVSALPAERPHDLEYAYDRLANQTRWTDDAGAFYERSLGENILNGHEATPSTGTGRPSALYLASNILSMGGVDTSIDRGGWVHLEYGQSGNVQSMTVRGQCHDTVQLCADPGGTDPDARDDALAAHCECAVEQHYQYRWDELNRLAEARRYDGLPSSDDWALQVRQRYLYDGANVRMVKATDDSMAGSGLPERAALYVYPGDFERRGLVAGVDSSGLPAYLADPVLDTETQYLVAGSRLVFKTGASPGTYGTGFEKDARLTYAVTNLIQSTSAVVDLFSGRLLEMGTFYPNGARETLRTERSAQFALEPMGFTGKEGDDEVGLVYFGERYLMPHLGRWASPDPLQVHAGGGGEFGNSYHYVAGNVLQARDPNGFRIILVGTSQERRSSFDSLQALTQQRLEMDAETGVVRVTGDRVENDAGDQGTEMVNRRIMDKDHVVVISREPDHPAGSHARPASPDRANGSEPGGSHTFVVIAERTDGAKWDVVSGEIGTDSPTHFERPIERFTMAHEISHADRNARGTSTPANQRADYHFIDPSGREHNRRTSREELDATGLHGTDAVGEFEGVPVAPRAVGPDGVNEVSENDVRAEQGAPLRQSYGTVQVPAPEPE